MKPRLTRATTALVATAALIGVASADSRPALNAARPNTDARPTLSAARPVPPEQQAAQAALLRLKEASKAVTEAARSAEDARQRLRKARQTAREARDELDRQRDLAFATTRNKKDDVLLAEHSRRLFIGRCVVLACLFAFTFLNGLARRSLSSAGPSMVAEGFVTVKRADEIFMQGFDAFAVGKFLVVPLLSVIGARYSLLLELFMMAGSLAAYLVAPASPTVLLGGWIVFRIFSAMAISTMLPFVGAWFPRQFYGRIFALLFCGFQTGYLVCSYYWGHLLANGRLHWYVPFRQCVGGFLVLLGVAARYLQLQPPQPPQPPSKASRAGGESAAEGGAPKQERRLELGALLHKVSTRWVFWAMLLACAAYSPAGEYSTHVTSYLKEMASVVRTRSTGFVCLQSSLCEGRYRGYVFSYVTALLLGSVLYDRATQLDRALLVVGLLAINVACWVTLALAEPNAPAAAWVKSVARVAPAGLRGWLGWRAQPNAAASVAPLLQLSGPTKTALASVAGATIALPSSLPFALFSLDFGKEGAAVLSALVSIGGAAAALTFLKAFPAILRRSGWFGVHALLALLSTVSCLAMGLIMVSDSRKFSRGYVIRSSLLNETVITLHACSRPSCSVYPMWRPGQRRTWGPFSGTHLKPHAPSSICHHCGRSDGLVECTVDEAAAAAALLTPFDGCGQWVREERPLRKPKQGWAFANDPIRFPLAISSDVTDPEHYLM